MVEIIRNKWCDDLEDLLQCPICMVRPRALIYQCVQGHHVCEDCKVQLSTCPTCSQRWSSARNRFAESLCIKLDEIKLSLIDPESEINKLLIPDRVSVASQTDGEAAAAGPAPKKADDEHGGPYPCKIGGCNVNLFFAPLMIHIQKDHSTEFIELPMGDGKVFENIWFFDFTEQMTFDRAFVVTGMGTFFLKLSSDCFGNFTGFVLMLHNGFVAKQFTYQLEIACCRDHSATTGKTYLGELCSCRTPVTVLNQKSLQIRRVDIQRMLEHQNNLSCTVLLGKKPATEGQQMPPRPNNMKKKNHPKQKNNAGHPPPRNLKIGQMPGPSNGQPMMNRQRRPQTASTGQQGQQQNQFQQPPRDQGFRDLNYQPGGPFLNNSNPPSRASSIPSLLYPNLRNLI